MKLKSLLKTSGVLIGIAWTVIFIFIFIHNSSNNRFTVQQTGEWVRPGYEPAPAVTTIQWSPKLAWQHTPVLPKILGIVGLIWLWISIWVVGTDRYLRLNVRDEAVNSVGLIILIVPLAFSLIMTLGFYSGRYANNWVEIPKARWDVIEKSGTVEKKGEFTWLDKQDSLKNLFNNKPIIR